MNQMATALLEASSQNNEVSPLLETAKSKYQEAETRKQAVIRERILQTEKAAKKASCPVRAYENKLRLTLSKGLGSMCPITFLQWRPGSPALASGKPCRIRWGLHSDARDLVVISYEYPQPLAGTSRLRSTYDLVPLTALEPCNCQGHIHRIACAPPRTRSS